MRSYAVVLLTLFVGIILPAQVPERTKAIQSTARQERAARFRRLADDIQMRTREDTQRVTKEYSAVRVLEMRRIIQEQVLETLNQSESPQDVREALLAVLGVKSLLPENPAWPFAYSSNLQGVRTFVVGYEWAYGPTAIPWIKVMIDGFRKVGLRYELAAETGDGLEGCDLELDQLDSPRSNEAWFLAHGSIIGASRYLEPVRIYSFDGYQFKDLWSAEERWWMLPSFVITKDAVTIEYFKDPDREHVFQTTIRLSSGGPVASTIPLQDPSVAGRKHR